MTIRKIALILGVLMLTYSCNKENNSIQSNRNVDVTKNPNAVVFGNVAFFAEGKKNLENATVKLFGEVGCYESDLLLTTSTDQDGNYTINYNADAYERYSIRLYDNTLDRQYLSEDCMSLHPTNLDCGNIIRSNNSETNFNIYKFLNVQLNIIDSSQTENYSFGSLKAYQDCNCDRQDDEKGMFIEEGVVLNDLSIWVSIAPPIKFEWTVKNQDGSYSSYEKVLHQTNDQCEDQELTIKY